MRWRLTHRGDRRARELADRHYNRQRIGTAMFVPPGRVVVLTAPGLVWATSWPYAEYVKHEWAGAWINSLFRKEAPGLASEWILEAIAATRFIWGEPPPLGCVTFVDPTKIRHKRDPGRAYLRAGFRRVGRTLTRGYLAFQLLPEAMPPPDCPLGATLPLIRSTDARD